MDSTMQQELYEWAWNDRAEEWGLSLFPDSKGETHFKDRLKRSIMDLRGKTKNVLPFIGKQKKWNVAPHLLRLKEVEPVKLDAHFYG